MDIRASYMGIELKNPIIIGACNLVDKPENLLKLQEAGASAIVYRSLFEEQLHLENLEFGNIMQEYNERSSEVGSMHSDFRHAGPKEYILKLMNAKKILEIPLFASLNAVYDKSWIDYAKKIEDAGVDGIELNLYTLPSQLDSANSTVVDWQIDILKKIREAVKIPLAVKLSPYYSNPMDIIRKMDYAGADAFVLFNRFFQPDIDLAKEELIFPYNLSNENDYRLSMRFAGLLHKNIDANICSSNGIFSGFDVAKMILAGADVVQIVSTIYKNGFGQISLILSQLQSFMDSKGYNKIDDFKGKLSKANINDPFAYNRAQYIDILMNSNDIFKKYPMI